VSFFPTEPARNPVKNSLMFRTPFRASSNSGLPFVTRRFANYISPWVDLTAVLQTYLHLLLKISESLARLESLLVIASPDGPSSPELKSLPIKSLASSNEDGDDRCGPPHHVSIFAYVQLIKGLEETAQSTSFVSQQNILNSSIMFQKHRLTPDLHLLTKFNEFVACRYCIPPY
jgi:hypothetical protein